jgi:hypothetical protein
MAGNSGAKGATKSGGSGHASNAALQDDEDKMARRRALFGEWKGLKLAKKEVHPARMIDYSNSPSPPR